MASTRRICQLRNIALLGSLAAKGAAKWTAPFAVAMIFLSAATTALQAQVERRATAADSVLVQQNHYRLLFRGIDVAPDLVPLGRTIIRDAYTAIRPLIGQPTDSVRDRLIEALDKRDSLLARLLPSKAERELLALNAREQRGSFWRDGKVVIP